MVYQGNGSLTLSLRLFWEAVGSESPTRGSGVVTSERVTRPLRHRHFHLPAQHIGRLLSHPVQVLPRRLFRTRSASAARYLAAHPFAGRLGGAAPRTDPGAAGAAKAGDERAGCGRAAGIHGLGTRRSTGEDAAATGRRATGDFQVERLASLQSGSNAVWDPIRAATGGCEPEPRRRTQSSVAGLARTPPMSPLRPHQRRGRRAARSNIRRIASQRPCWPVDGPINEIAARARMAPSSMS